MTRCTLIGILDDGWAGLSDAARGRLRAAGVIIGAGRTLDLVRPHLADSTELRDMDGALTRVPEWIAAAQAAGRPAAVLATGDPLCHGIAAWLNGKLDAPFDILPNVMTTLIVFVPLMMALNIITESSLSFLSIGVQPPDASWGTIIQDGQALLYNRPVVSLAPGIAIVITVLALNILGDGVRDAFDPRSKLRPR